MTLEELKDLEAAATPGPWRAKGHYVSNVQMPEDLLVADTFTLNGYSEPDAAFIAAARNMLPRLIAAAAAAKVLRPLARECIGEEDAFYAADDELGRALAALEAP